MKLARLASSKEEEDRRNGRELEAEQRRVKSERAASTKTLQELDLDGVETLMSNIEALRSSSAALRAAGTTARRCSSDG